MDIIKKKLIAEMLQDWYIIDNILFGGIPKYYISEKQDYNNYLRIKKTYLSTLFEYYNHINYKSRINDIPKNSKELKEQSYDIYEYCDKMVLSEMKENRKNISKIVQEGLTLETSNKIDHRLSMLRKSSLFNKCFMENANEFCVHKSKINDVRGILLNNCLTEARKELIKYSYMYYPYF